MPSVLSRFFAVSLFFSVTLVSASEMTATLREASRLYQGRQFDEAVAAARQFLAYSPDNLEAMLLIAMSRFNQKNYSEASEWLQKVARIDRNHPVARHYITLLQEIEHRKGPFATDLLTAKASTDRRTAGEAFKKAWFGHSFPEESLPTPVYFDSNKDKIAPVAIEVPPPIEKVLAEKAVAKMAEQAFSDGVFVKAYLFYSQLLAANPNNRSYLLGKAGSALRMKRFNEVIKILGPVMLARDEKSFTSEELKLADRLMLMARQRISSGDSENP